MQCPCHISTADDNCLGELNYSKCLVYLDDVIIYSSTQEGHLKCLQAVLDWFWLHGLKLKPSKCEFFKEKIEYLEHSVSSKVYGQAGTTWKPSPNTLSLLLTQPSRVFLDWSGITGTLSRTLLKLLTPCLNICVGWLPRRRRRGLSWVKPQDMCFKSWRRLWWALWSWPIQTLARNIRLK